MTPAHSFRRPEPSRRDSLGQAQPQNSIATPSAGYPSVVRVICTLYILLYVHMYTYVHMYMCTYVFALIHVCGIDSTQSIWDANDADFRFRSHWIYAAPNVSSTPFLTCANAYQYVCVCVL